MIQVPTSRTRCTIGTHVGSSGVCVGDAGTDGCEDSPSDSQTAVRNGMFMHAIVSECISA